MSKQLTDRVGFDFIRYANCWEDADLLVRALQVKPGDKVLSIASAGDNSFALLAQNPELVVAVDVNPVQLYLCELKKTAFATFDHETFLRFLGFVPSGNRLAIYTQIQQLLPAETKRYWDEHLDQIDAGVINTGKFERYFGYFRKKILPWIHSEKTIAKLFHPKSAAEQEIFYREKWNTWRWRLLFRIFFSRFVMGKYGRDPEFMKEVKVTVWKYIFGKAEAELEHPKTQRNLYLHHIMTGRFAPQLPYYARKENFETIRKNLSKIIFLQGYAQDAIREYGPFTAFNLSNIFEYLPADTTKQVATSLAEGATSGARFAYWNLMVPRELSVLLPDKLTASSFLTAAMQSTDMGFFYRKFNLDLKK